MQDSKLRVTPQTPDLSPPRSAKGATTQPLLRWQPQLSHSTVTPSIGALASRRPNTPRTDHPSHHPGPYGQDLEGSSESAPQSPLQLATGPPRRPSPVQHCHTQRAHTGTPCSPCLCSVTSSGRLPPALWGTAHVSGEAPPATWGPRQQQARTDLYVLCCLSPCVFTATCERPWGQALL